MLIAIGPGVTSLQDYTESSDASTVEIISAQGSAQDTVNARVYDRLSQYLIQTEDDMVILDETDAHGWPTLNLLQNPSFEGTFSSGIAPSWGGNQTSNTGVTVASSGTALYGSESQSLTLANVSLSLTAIGFFQTLNLPVDELGNPIVALPYVASVFMQVVGSAGVNMSGNIGIEWYNAANTRLRIDQTNFNLGSGIGAWTRYAVQGTPPAGSTHVAIHLYLAGTNATNSVQVLFDGAQFEYATFAAFKLPGDITALAAGKYPTAYCDSAQPGCYVDRGISGLAYRQLRLFGGFIRHTHAEYYGGPERFFDLQAVDYGILLTEAPANLIINSQADNSAISAAFVYAANQGFLVGIDYTTHVSSIMTVDNMVFSWQTTADVLNQISNQTVAAYWVDYYKYLWYMPALAVSAPFNLSGTPDFVTTYPFSTLILENDGTESRTEPIIEGSTQLSAPLSETQTGNGTTTAFTFNSGNAITQIDSLTVGGVSQTIGLSSVNTFAQGYNALLTPENGIITFQTAPANASSIKAVYRYAFPVLVRLHWPGAKRKIHHHQKEPRITSQQAAIDRANADLAQYKKARPIGSLTIYTPEQVPAGLILRVGSAIQITFAPAGLSMQLFQIQEIDTYFYGNGKIKRDLKIGFYRPNFIIMMANAQKQYLTNSDTSSSILQDVLSLTDGWAITDNVVSIVANPGVWGNPTSSTWNGANVWN